MAIALRIRLRLWVALAAIAAALPATAGAAEARCEAMPAGCTACDCCEKTSPPTTNLDPIPAPIVGAQPPDAGHARRLPRLHPVYVPRPGAVRTGPEARPE